MTHSILNPITDIVQHSIPPTSTLTADIRDTYNFLLHIITTDLWPDIMRWDEAHKVLVPAVCFETNFKEAAQRKSAKYTHPVEQAQARGFMTETICLQVKSCGVPDLPGFATKLSLPQKKTGKAPGGHI